MAPSADLYGSDRALLHALPDLAKTMDICVVFAADGPVVDRLRELGCDTHVVPDFALRTRNLRPRSLVPWLWRSARAVATTISLDRREGRFDLIYSNTSAAWIGGVLAKVLRRPHLLHLHELPYQRRWYPKVLLGWTRLTADLVVCNSAFTRSRVVEAVPALADRAIVVHNGLPLPDPVDPTPAASRLRVACVGRIHPKKGQWVLIEAAVLALEAGHRWQLHFYGDALPEHRPILEHLQKRVADTGVDATFHGFIEDTARHYLLADVAVVPSVVPEEFSLVCVEAQAMATPVVATGPGGPSEVLEHEVTGLIVPPNDAEALAGAILGLEGDPVRRALMGQAGVRRARDMFGESVYSRRMREVCLGLLEPPVTATIAAPSTPPTSTDVRTAGATSPAAD